jgi:hypothetical protein
MAIRAVRWEELAGPNLHSVLYNIDTQYEAVVVDASGLKELCKNKTHPRGVLILPDISTMRATYTCFEAYQKWKSRAEHDKGALYIDLRTPFSGKDRCAEAEKTLPQDWRELTAHIPDKDDLQWTEPRAAIYCAAQAEASLPVQTILLSEDRGYVFTPRLTNKLGKFKKHKFKVERALEYAKRRK